MSGANQQNPLAANPAQQADPAKKAHDEKIARENEQYERIAEQARAILNLEKGNWRRIDKRNPGDVVVPPGQAHIRTADISTGLLPPGRYRRGSTPGRSDSEFDVLVTESGSVTPCYRRSIDVGINTFHRPLSDSDWKKAQGEVLDMLYAGRGRHTATLDWPQPQQHEHGVKSHVTEKYIMLYLDAAEERGMNVVFGGEVERYLANVDQKQADRIYQRRQAIEDKFQAKAGEKEALGTEIHDMKQDAKALNTSPKLTDPNPLVVESDEQKKAKYITKLDADMGVNPAQPKTDQEKTEVLKTEFDSIDARLKRAEDAKARLEAQMKVITDLRGKNPGQLSANDQKMLRDAERRVTAACNGNRLDVIRGIEAEIGDLKLRSAVLQEMIGRQAAAVPNTVALNATKATLETQKGTLESTKANLEAEINVLRNQRAAESVRAGGDTSAIDAQLDQKTRALADNTAAIGVNKAALETNTKDLAQDAKVVESTTALQTMKNTMAGLNQRLVVLERGSPPDGANPAKQSMADIRSQHAHGVLQQTYNAARELVPQQQPQSRAP